MDFKNLQAELSKKLQINFPKAPGSESDSTTKLEKKCPLPSPHSPSSASPPTSNRSSIRTAVNDDSSEDMVALSPSGDSPISLESPASVTAEGTTIRLNASAGHHRAHLGRSRQTRPGRPGRLRTSSDVAVEEEGPDEQTTQSPPSHQGDPAVDFFFNSSAAISSVPLELSCASDTDLKEIEKESSQSDSNEEMMTE